MFSSEYFKTFKKKLFLSKPPVAAFVSSYYSSLLDKVNCSVIGICQRSLLKKTHCGQFLLKKFVVLTLSMFFIHIYIYIWQKPFNTFLLINLRKTKTCPKLNIVARAVCSDPRIFRQVFVHYYFFVNFPVYFNHVRINGWFHLSRSLWEIPFLYDNCSEKQYARKISFLQQDITELYQMFEGL